MESQHLQAVALDADFPTVDQSMIATKLGGKVGLAVAECLDASVESVLNYRGEPKQVAPQAFEVAQEVAAEGDALAVPTFIAADI